MATAVPPPEQVKETDRKSAKIVIDGVEKRYRGSRGSEMTALENIDLQIGDGEFFCIVGPSGCGKSTLLRIIADLDTPTAGGIEIRQHNSARPLSSMVFQEHALYPWMTVLENAAFGLEARGIPKMERIARVSPLIEKVGLKRFEHYYPTQLSGGMRQRVSLVRAFVNDPEVLLMDEPFAALDAQNKILLQTELMRIWEESPKAVVYITHSIDEALFLGDRIAVMTSSPGRIKEILDVPFHRPRSLFAIQGRPEYSVLSRRIWDMLEVEVRHAQQSTN